MSVITVEKLRYRYPHTKELALDGIDFSVEKGEFIGIIGENGAGKSTLSQAIMGLVPQFYKGAYGGKVMVDSVTGKGPRKIPTGPGEYILRFRKGAKLVATDRPLKYSNPQAVPQWFEHAKRQNKQFWIDGVKEKIGGK